MFFFFKQKTAYEMRISDWIRRVLFRSAWLPCRPSLISLHLAAYHPRVCRMPTAGGACASSCRPLTAGLPMRPRGLSPSRCSARSEERRVGNECFSQCSSRLLPEHSKQTSQYTVLSTHSHNHNHTP